ncbi:MAG: sulfatase [Rikenellaceae bacterium]
MKFTDKLLFSSLSIMLLPFGAQEIHAANKAKNVLFILVDDLGWMDLGFMGSKYYETPNIDKLADAGMVFTDAYAACQVSSPSRGSIMSGLYPANHGITNWIGEKSGEDWREMNRHSKVLPAPYEWAISSDFLLLPELLQQNRFTTFIAGKWHLGENENEWPEYNGFDINKGGWASGSPKGGYFAPYINPRLENGEDGENLSMRLANETVDFIDKNGKKPFFAYLAFYAVHGGIETTEENWQYFRDKAEKMGIAESGYIIDRTLPVRQTQDNPVYAGLVKQMDDAVGVVLDHLEAKGLMDETMIVFTSDNGGVSSGDAFSTSLLPLRGGKGRQWEGGIRVPLVIKTPEMSSNSEKCSTPVNGIDFYPTIAKYLDIDIPSDVKLDGVDITPLLDGGKIGERSLFWHYPHYGNQGGEPSTIVRSGDWKLIYYHEDLRCELYNLAIDISEHEPLNIQYPEKVEELKGEILSFLKETNAKLPVADMKYNPIEENKVKEGYRTKVIQFREDERLKMLDKNFKPNDNWWGSKVTID